MSEAQMCGVCGATGPEVSGGGVLPSLITKLRRREAELEASCAAMRELLEGFADPENPMSLATRRSVQAALAPDAGKALLEKLALLNQATIALAEAQRDQRILLDAHTETVAKLSAMIDLAEKARAQAFAECAEIAETFPCEPDSDIRDDIAAAIRAKAGGT